MRALLLIFSLLFIAALTSGAGAETIHRTIVINADGYLDVAAGRIVAPAIVVVEEGKITAINPASLPEGAEEINLAGQILLPGLIDAHTHITGEISGDWVMREVTENAADAALWGARNARRTLLAGFTTIRNLGSTGFADVALMRAIDKGFVPGPRIIPAAHALGTTGGHCDTTGFAPGILERDYRSGVADGVDEITKAVRYQIKHGAKVIKFCATAGVLSFEGPVGAQQYSLAEMRAIVAEAERHGITTAAHAHGTDGIIAAAEAGVTSVEHGSMLTRKAAKILKRNGTWYDPQLYLNYSIDKDALPPAIRAKMEYLTPRMFESFGIAMDEGLKIVFGTDAGVYPHGENAREFGYRVRHGMSEIEAIRGASLYAAQMMRLDDRGQIAAGLLADIVAVAGDPLAEITLLENVTFVMKGGEIFKGK